MATGLDTSIIKNAMLAGIDTPTAEQIAQVEAFANSIKAFVLTLKITTLPTTGLSAPDGLVTGELAYELS